MIARQKRHGFALLLALAIMAIVAAAIVTLMAATSRQGQRALDDSRTAQLEELLLAGVSDVPLHFKAHSPKAGESWDVELPPSLAEQNATLHIAIKSLDQNRATISIRAAIATRSLEQLSEFAREGDGWSLKSIALNPAN